MQYKFVPRLVSFLVVLSLLLPDAAVAEKQPDNGFKASPSTSKPYKSITTIRYGDCEHQNFDLYMPQHVKGLVPVVLWIHGGGFLTGDKSSLVPLFLLQSGFAIASVDYRLSTEAAYPAQLFDCKAAVRALRALSNRYQIDATHIAAFGTSAGGTLAALLGTTNGDHRFDGNVGNFKKSSSDVQAVVDSSGITDVNDYLKIASRQMRQYVDQFLGATSTNDFRKANLASPVNLIGHKVPPFLIMHGTSDAVVPIAQSQELYQKLKVEGDDVKLVLIPGAGHPLRGYEPAKYVIDFLTNKLRKSS